MNRAFALNPIAARELEESISEFKNSPVRFLKIQSHDYFFN